jgi:hypothetical protein
VNSQRYDELECIGGPFDGDRLKIPAGAKRLPVPLRRPGGKPSFCERGTYERVARSQKVDGIERGIAYLRWVREEK